MVKHPAGRLAIWLSVWLVTGVERRTLSSILRKDPVAGRWVVNLEREGKKAFPHFSGGLDQKANGCPFCEGNEDATFPEVFAIRDKENPENSPGWKVRVIPSISPIFAIEGGLGKRGEGIYDLMRGVGAHEIIIETPKHINSFHLLDGNQMELVLKTYIQRISDLKKDKRFKYLLIFKNHGRKAGASRIEHTHSQLIALPVTPKMVKEELVGARKYFAYKERCIFCDIIKQERSTGERVICENDDFLAFCPFASRFPYETWILPKKHQCNFEDIPLEMITSLAQILREFFGRLFHGLSDPPYHLFLYTGPNPIPRRGHWQTLSKDFHWHFEVLPRLGKVAGFEWSTGVHINPILPENAASKLREVYN